MNASAYHEAVAISLLRKAMAYDQKAFEEDWNVMLALAMIQAVEGEKEHMQRLMAHSWRNILAYQANNPDALPFEVQL